MPRVPADVKKRLKDEERWETYLKRNMAHILCSMQSQLNDSTQRLGSQVHGTVVSYHTPSRNQIFNLFDDAGQCQFLLDIIPSFFCLSELIKNINDIFHQDLHFSRILN